MSTPERTEKIKSALPTYLTFFSQLRDNPQFYTDSFNKAAAKDPQLIELASSSLNRAVKSIVPQYFVTTIIEQDFLDHLFIPTDYIPQKQELLAKLVEYHTWVVNNIPSNQQQEQLSKMLAMINFMTDLVSQGQNQITSWFTKYDQKGQLLSRGDLLTSAILAPYLAEIQMALIGYKKNYL